MVESSQTAVPKLESKPILNPQQIEAMAEDAKNKGNDLFKANDFLGAISLYTESICKSLRIFTKFWLFLELLKNEGVFTNRAMAYIK